MKPACLGASDGPGQSPQSVVQRPLEAPETLSGGPASPDNFHINIKVLFATHTGPPHSIVERQEIDSSYLHIQLYFSAFLWLGWACDQVLASRLMRQK